MRPADAISDAIEDMIISGQKRRQAKTERRLRLADQSVVAHTTLTFNGTAAQIDHLVLRNAVAHPKIARPSRPANRLTGVAACLLPASDRARYAEEFSAELHDLAQSGAGSLRQVLYALRQMRATIPLRFALRSPQRRGAAP